VSWPSGATDIPASVCRRARIQTAHWETDRALGAESPSCPYSLIVNLKALRYETFIWCTTKGSTLAHLFTVAESHRHARPESHRHVLGAAEALAVNSLRLGWFVGSRIHSVMSKCPSATTCQQTPSSCTVAPPSAASVRRSAAPGTIGISAFTTAWGIACPRCRGFSPTPPHFARRRTFAGGSAQAVLRPSGCWRFFAMARGRVAHWCTRGVAGLVAVCCVLGTLGRPWDCLSQDSMTETKYIWITNFPSQPLAKREPN
jgi:hypothetical protein